MTNPNNGASLEDCHSNFFALTDLCGIKWRRLVSDGTMGSGHAHHSYGPLDDPVLSSFARCLAADILCVWRKSPSVRYQQHQQQQTALTPNDPFHPNAAPPPASQFMHHHSQPPGGSSMPNAAAHSQMHMQPQSSHMPSHIMSPHVGVSMGPGHMNSPHHMNVPPPYPSGPQHNAHHPHSHGLPPQPSPIMHNQMYNVNPSLNGPKELWIFWYGEEPELSSLVSPQLLKTESEQGSWENGLSYECRTLLFKALHNLIERCLLARDFVRIDKWFIQPCDDSQRIGVKSFPMQLSFSFSFFLHGESTVCMSVDVRQHPPIRRTTKYHLAAASQNHAVPVILAPHGLAGTLTGVSYKINEQGTHKILEEWKHFYPVEAALTSPLYDTALPTCAPYSSPHSVAASSSSSSNGNSSSPTPANNQTNSSIPPVLEVKVGGVVMRYPSCYILCTDMDELPAVEQFLNQSVQSGSSLGNSVTAPKSRTCATTDSETAACPSGPSPGKPQGSAQVVHNVEGLLPERVWQESILCSTKGNNTEQASGNTTTSSCGPGTPSSNGPSSTDAVDHWDFVDPSKKALCTCSKCNRLSGARGNQGLGSISLSSQSTKGGSKMKRNSYHRRNPQLLSQLDSWGSLWDLTEDTSTANGSSSSCHTTVNGSSVKGNDGQNLTNHSSSNNRMPGTPIGGPPSYKGGPASITAGVGSEGIGASPASIAPSPLATPRSQQPASVPQLEPPMPTLSPQSTSDKIPAPTPDNIAPKSVSSLSNQLFSPLASGGIFDGAKAESGEHTLVTNNGSNNAGGNQSQLSQSTTINGVNNSSADSTQYAPANTATATQPVTNKGLKRPILPSKDYEQLLAEECCSQPSDVIYDYSSMQAWLNHPVKRMKTNEGTPKTTMYSWGFGMKKVPEVSPSSTLANGSRDKPSGKRQNNSDPYEFDDEHHHAASANPESVKKEEVKEEKPTFFTSELINGGKSSMTKNLFTNEGIQPSLRDLEQIFDNSDTSSDETFQAPTPPGSNKPATVEETAITTIKTKPGLSSLRPEELSKMFPTPPSHEHNPISSPCGLQPDTPSMDLTDHCLRRPPDSYPGLGSPPDEVVDIRLEPSSIFLRQTSSQPHNRTHSSQDWSFVYKPSSVYKMLGSSKYAPLPVLPSQQLPPIPTVPINTTYTPSWFNANQQNSSNSNNNPPPAANALAGAPSTSSAVQNQQQQHPPMVGPGLAGQLHLRPGLSPISPVPSAIRAGPPSDLGSPPSSNMYLRPGHGSVGQPPAHGTHAPPPPSGPPHMYGPRGPEAHALVVNLSLSDSVINLFRDHNFDSCTMCVCNAGAKVVGNIRGSEVGLYIPDPSPDEDPVRCNCGFSASVNRRLAHRAGLFYEDEFEVATAACAPLVLPPDEWFERKKTSLLLLDPKYPNPNALAADKDATSASAVVDAIPPFLLEMLREQSLVSCSRSASRFSGDVINHRILESMYNDLDFIDGNRAAMIALEHGRAVMLDARGSFPRLPEDTMPLKPNCNYIHRWPYLWGRGPQSSQDVMQIMRTLHPLLQEAVHSKAWDAQYTVSGPLTWRQFHRLAGRGTDDRCEPQPIPSILSGSEKDFASLSPLAIKYWEKLLLEPYAYPRDVAYIVVAPETDFVLYKVRTFFRELSAVYETCQFGRHCPISKVLRDGIMRVGRNAATKLAAEPVDEWFSLLPDIPTASTLRLYAQVCKYYLAPQLASIPLDQSLLDSPNQSSQFPRPPQERPTPSPKMPPPSSDPTSNTSATQGPPTPKSEYDSEYTSKEGLPIESVDEDERDPPAVIVYLVEPFGFGADNNDLHRMANLGLLRGFASMLNTLPENVRNNVTLKVIPMEDITSLGNSCFDSKQKMDQLRHLSLNIYSQCRRLLVHQNNVKSLTGFGPAAASELFLKSKEEKKKIGYKLYAPPYILAPTKQKVSEGVEWLGGIQGHTIGGMVSSGNGVSVGPGFSPHSSVLYIAYCISEDQRWLLASATDDRGELLETTIISIYIPNRSKRRKASARKHGLQKLMDFILGIMSTGVQPWRLVVGRLGRVGHGELESWSSLLSRKSLLRASNQLKESCRQCNLQFPADSPCVLSACLVSLEPDSCLRLMPDQFTPDERFGSSSTLSTPQDISCSHILVFPTSATTQSSQTAFQDQHINGPDLGDEDLFLINVSDVNEMGDGIDGMQDLQLGDIFGGWDDNAPTVPSPVGGSPRRDSTSQPGSPGGVGASGRQSPFQSGGQGRLGGRGDSSDDLGTVLQQPLALGYLVSTAPAGQLPSWFWASCPQRSVEKSTGVFLKSALHLHSHSVLHNDDLLPQQSSAKQHPLDSQFTTDVLRFVLEGYNALSWLCLDPKTHDRSSCLPVHIQKLLQLYNTIDVLV